MDYAAFGYFMFITVFSKCWKALSPSDSWNLGSNLSCFDISHFLGLIHSSGLLTFISFILNYSSIHFFFTLHPCINFYFCQLPLFSRKIISFLLLVDLIFFFFEDIVVYRCAPLFFWSWPFFSCVSVFPSEGMRRLFFKFQEFFCCWLS